MNPEPRVLFGRRLAQGRRMRALSLRGLAERMHGAVSYNALHKYEQGEMMPDSTVLIAVAEALDLDLDFFFRPFTAELGEINFRKRSGLGAKEEVAIRARAVDYFERHLEIEAVLGLKETLQTSLAGKSVCSADEVEAAADRLRTDWKLGEDAIPSVIEMLESRGLPVVEVDAPKAFDGFSGWADGRPLIVVGRWLDSDLARKRFTLLHELAHLLLKFKVKGRECEHFCHRFAGAMLIPRSVFVRELGGHRTRIAIQELLDMKARYGLSLAAIMRRASDLGLVGEADYRQFCVFYKIKGWHKQEPGGFVGSESSSRFEQLVLHAAAEDHISASKGASLLNTTLEEFRDKVLTFA